MFVKDGCQSCPEAVGKRYPFRMAQTHGYVQAKVDVSAASPWVGARSEEYDTACWRQELCRCGKNRTPLGWTQAR
ncbi:hypothetical protein Hthe01_12610 [Hydrogenophilus thermoluteolus]|nr:hypothetical protein Hthe01_12610 [Hydrogenophilus thermoluteolus]